MASGRISLLVGTVAILTTTATIVLTTLFAVALTRADLSVGVLAIAASVLGLTELAALVTLIFLHVLRSQRGGRRNTGVLSTRWKKAVPQLAGCVFLISNGITMATLIWMRLGEDLSSTALRNSMSSLLIAAFVLWSISCLAQGLFQLRLAASSESAAQEGQSLHDEEPQVCSELKETIQPQPSSPSGSRGRKSLDYPSSTISSRKRSGSNTVNSIRSSFSHVVRPMSSKTRLVTQKSTYRAASLDSGTGERELVEDGFDSWDTSAVDPQSWQTVMASSNPSPVPGRGILETIPASPTASRSPSPGFPLDLQPPRSRNRRSRSYSPAASSQDTIGREIAPSPSESEAHIHPLFRSDSPTPPPSATPGTVVTAAPGAGLVISDRRSVRRMRSGSLPTTPSPLVHSNSMDDIALERVEDESGSSTPPQREMTPPIPEWILGAGNRSSLMGYTRRKCNTGLGALGEVKEREH